MQIYFVRHASAGEAKLNPAKDEQRPLDETGVEQCHIVGRALVALQIAPDVVVSSPLLRARQTAAIVAEELGHKDEIVLDEALRPEAGYEQFEQLLARYKDKDAIMVVGHNPSQTEFVNQLVTGKGSDTIEIKKGAVARVDKENGQRAVLKWLMPPKVLRAIQQASAKSSRPKAVSK